MRSMRKYIAPTPAKVTLAVCVLLVALAALGFASEGGEGAHQVDTGKQMKDFAWRCLDFAALFALLAWALKKANVKGALADRRTGIEKMLKEQSRRKNRPKRSLPSTVRNWKRPTGKLKIFPQQ